MKKNEGGADPPIAGASRLKRAVPGALLVVISLAAFSYTVRIREPWFGALSHRHHQWLTGSTVKFAKNWYREGAWNLGFLMLENPRSIEFPTIDSRGPYPSYPPGTILPIHLTALIAGREPDPPFVMTYNLVNHLLIAVFLALTIYFFLLQIGMEAWNAGALSAVPLFLELFLPGPLYWHQNVFFSDQAVILPAALFLFLEVLRGNVLRSPARAAIAVAQGAVLFFGTLTDWFMFVLALGAFAKRIARGEMGNGFVGIARNTFLFWFPAALALVLFMYQLNSFDMFSGLVSRFKVRTALSAEGASKVTDFYTQFWKRNFALNFGNTGIFLAWSSLALFLLGAAYAAVKRFRGAPVCDRAMNTLSLIGMLLAPCFLHNYCLRNHSAIHDFSALKFIIPLATVPFVLLPLLASAVIGKESAIYFMAPSQLPAGPPVPDKKKKAPAKAAKPAGPFRAAPYLLVIATFTFAGGYLAKEHPRFAQLFPQPEPSFALIGDFFSRNIGYDDVVFSPYFEIKTNPPQLLSYTMKRVYKAGVVNEMRQMLKTVPGDYTVDLLINEPGTTRGFMPDAGIDPGIRELIRKAKISGRIGNLVLYKIRRDGFLATDRSP